MIDSLFPAYKKDKAAFFISGLLFLIPLGMASIKSWASTGFYVLLLTAFYVLWQKRNTEPVKLGSYPKGMFFFLVCVLLSLVNSDDMGNSMKRLEKLFAIFMLIPLLISFRKSDIQPHRIIGFSSVISCFIMGGVALYTVYGLGKGRAALHYHPIIFGNLAILVAVIAACAAMTGFVAGKFRWIAVAAVPVAIMASLLSQSRGGWVAIPAVMAVSLLLYANKIGKKKLVAGVSLLLIVVIASPYAFPGSIGKQVERTRQSIVSFLAGENQNSSLGARFLMWDVAMQVWQENPVFGSGVGDFEHDSQALIDSGRSNLDRSWPHAHNIFFEYLSMTGLLGLAAMFLALFVLPFIRFYRVWVLSEKTTEEVFVSSVGILVLVCFFVFGLSEGWLARSVFVTTYSLLLASFLSGLSCLERGYDSGEIFEEVR